MRMGTRKGLPVRMLLLLGLLLLAAAPFTETTKSGADEEETRKAGKEDSSESWTIWAKDKISEGLGLKHQQLQEEEAAQKARDTVESAKIKAQEVASGE